VLHVKPAARANGTPDGDRTLKPAELSAIGLSGDGLVLVFVGIAAAAPGLGLPVILIGVALIAWGVHRLDMQAGARSRIESAIPVKSPRAYPQALGARHLPSQRMAGGRI
jgi:hypothetical protein